MNKTALTIITIGLVITLGIIFTGGKKQQIVEINNVEITNGIQYVHIDAGGGYSPQITEAKGGIPTKLIVKTNGTFDCSSSLVIPSIGYQKMLPQTGETEIDIGTGKTGETFKALCGMGMYNFQIKFI